MVLLVNFGAPATLDDVAPFLRRLAGVEPPRVVEKALVERYRAIGGGSPLAKITREQADLLADATGRRFPIRCAYCYTSPTLEEMINECFKAGTEKILFFVMSPYSSSRTVGVYMKSVEAYLAYFSSMSYRPEVTFVHGWHEEALFIEAWVERIREVRPEDGFCLFSAHSLPRSLQGEPYVSQIEQTVAALADRLKLKEYALGWQSIPPNAGEPWIGPSVESVIDNVASTATRLVEIPIGFVSDHLETLYDMDIVHARYAQSKGLAFSRVPSLNGSPRFIAALKKVLEAHLGEGQ